MPPTDDAFSIQLLGQVQELRAAIERLNNRAEARAFKARLVALHETSRGATVAPDVAKVVDEFSGLARTAILKLYGTSAWEDPETIEEAKARMGRLPPAPGPGVLDRINERVPPPLTDEDLDALERAANDMVPGQVAITLPVDYARRLVTEVRRMHRDVEEIRRAAQALLNVCPRPEDDRGRKIRDEAVAVIGSHGPAGDEWLQRAVEEIGGLEVHEGYVDLAKALAILRKHRDGKA